MNFKHVFIIQIILFININWIYGQYLKVDQEILFQSKIDNPIMIEPLKQGEKYLFYAVNRSFYPYQLNINFDELRNLTPEFIDRDFIIQPGRNFLFSISIKDKNLGHSYRYKITYKIGAPSKNVDLEYPYLIPLRENTSFDLMSFNKDIEIYHKDYFKISKGDTIFNMRKGYITAVPNMFHNADRISNRESLEILHKDGTIMIYENIDAERIFVKAGTNINPGQPLGLIDKDSCLEVYLYMIEKNGRLKKLDINYFIEEGKVEPFSGELKDIRILHPLEIITKEMSKREIKNYKK